MIYVRKGWMHMPLWRRLLAKLSPWESQQVHDLRKARSAIKGARRDSRWLGKRPFSDKYGYDGSAESSRIGDHYDDTTGYER